MSWILKWLNILWKHYVEIKKKQKDSKRGKVMVIYKKDDDVMYPYKMFFYDCIWEEDKIIYPASNCNAICETNIATGETTVIGSANEQKERLLFYGIYKWREYLILPGRNARPALNLFNTKTNEWSYIVIEENKKNWLNFREEDVFEYDGYLYIFSLQLGILKVNLEEKNVEYLFYPDIKPDDDRHGEITFIDNMVYIPLKHDKKIYKFDLSTAQWMILEVNTELRGIDTLCYDGNLFWMSGVGKMICSWDEKNNVGVSYKRFPQRYKKLVNRAGEEGWWFCKSIIYNRIVYFVPCDANMMLTFNTENGEAKEFYIADEWEEKEDMRIGRFSSVKYMGAKRQNKILMMLSNKNKNLIFIDMEKRTNKKIEMKLKSEAEVNKLLATTSVIKEGPISLQKWLKYLSGQE